MRVLVTGSAGFVGRELVAALKAAGHHVIGIDVNPESQSTEFHRHDLTTHFDTPLRFDACVHLASSVGGILFNLERADIITYNDLINTNVARILNTSGCDSLVFFSSINVFEGRADFPHEKLSSRSQTTGYALSKAIAEEFFASRFGNLVVIRPTNIFGQSQSRDHAIFGESHVIPDLMHKIASATDAIEVFGDGSQVRNFLHVHDITGFLPGLLGVTGRHYLNLRSEILISIGQLAEELIRLAGKPLAIRYRPEFMKYEKIRITNFPLTVPRSLGFEPRVTSITQGLTTEPG